MTPTTSARSIIDEFRAAMNVVNVLHRATPEFPVSPQMSQALDALYGPAMRLVSTLESRERTAHEDHEKLLEAAQALLEADERARYRSEREAELEQKYIRMRVEVGKFADNVEANSRRMGASLEAAEISEKRALSLASAAQQELERVKAEVVELKWALEQQEARVLSLSETASELENACKVSAKRSNELLTAKTNLLKLNKARRGVIENALPTLNRTAMIASEYATLEEQEANEVVLDALKEACKPQRFDLEVDTSKMEIPEAQALTVAQAIARDLDAAAEIPPRKADAAIAENIEANGFYKTDLVGRT